MTKISFIIPIYNCELYIGECVNNIIDINLDKYEIILVDDGSQDNSGKICDDLASRFKNIVVIHQKNGGASAARNSGINNSTGEYIVFLDADDCIESLKLKDLIEVITEDKSIDLLIYGESFDYYRRGVCYRRDSLYYKKEGKLSKDEWVDDYFQLFINNSLSPVWNKIFKREIIVNHQIYFSEELFLYEDLMFVLNYMIYSECIYNSTQIVYHYQQPEDEGNSKRRVKKLKSISTFIDMFEQKLEEMIFHLEIQNTDVQVNLKKLLVNLYITLLRDKIAVSNRNELLESCNEMRNWYYQHEYLFDRNVSTKDKQLINNILNENVDQLMIYQRKTELRHKIAVKIKSSVLYQKVRGLNNEN